MNEYWIVKERNTGRSIAHCGDINDAIMLVSLVPHNRYYVRHRFMMDQIIDVTSTTDKQLPGQRGLSAGRVEQLNPHREKLPEGQQEPIII